MTTLTEGRHAGGFIVWETFRGTETAIAVLWGKADATAADVDAVVLLRGPAIVNGNDLVFTGTPTAPEIAAAHTALAAVGILTR